MTLDDTIRINLLQMREQLLAKLDHIETELFGMPMALAHRCARLASDVDWNKVDIPNGDDTVDTLHFLSRNIAGSRADEVYGGGE